MTLKDYIQTLPKDRLDLAATDLNEAAKIEQEHAATPGAVLEDAPQAEAPAPAENPQSFDLNSDDDAKRFIGGMELSHPTLTNKLRQDPAAWGEMLDLDAQYNQRLRADGGFKLAGDESDEDYFKWAYGRGILESDTSFSGIVSGLAKGFTSMVKGAAKLGALTVRSSTDASAATELAATTVDAARSAVSEYEQLGAGLASIFSGNDPSKLFLDENPQVKMMAKFELAKFTAEEQKNHNAWRKAISASFAEVPVDGDSVEVLAEAFDISNVIGAGAGKLVTRGVKRAGAGAAAEMLGKSRKIVGSDLVADVASKIPVVGAPYKRAILERQIEGLSVDAQAAFELAAIDKSRLAAMRATLAANPASSPTDPILTQIAKGEQAAAASQAAFDLVNGQLNARRGEVTQALNLEGRGLLNRAAAGTLDASGSVVRATGQGITRARRGLSELLTGETDDQVVGGAADAASGGLASKGNILTRVGGDMKAAAQTAGQNGSTIPYFRRLRQNRDASKLTRSAAALVDNSHAAWALDGAADLAKAGAAGVPVSGLFGYAASGGDLQAAAESAGAGAAFGVGGGAYGQWEAFKDPRYRYEELLANRRQFRDSLSQREVNGESQLQIFDKLDAGAQIALASYAQGKPDVAFRFVNEPGGPSGFYSRDENVVVINTASKTPVEDIFRHEAAHFIERHGFEAQVRELYLGDAEKGVIGQYTEMDKLGNPVFVESSNAEGEKTYTYKLNAAGEKLKAEYEAKVQAFDPAFAMSPSYLASELFAEQYADYTFRGGLRRDLSRNVLDSVVDMLANRPLMKEFMGGIGLLFDRNDNVVGTDVFTGLKSNEEVRKLISKFTADVGKGRKIEIAGEVEDHVFTETELRDPAVATKWLQSGGAMRFGPDGKPVFNANGTPQFLTEKEADALQRDFANELITEIEKHVAANPADAELLQRREIVDIKGVKRTVFSGRRVPVEVIDALDAQKRFNPHQIAHLRAMSATSDKHGVGAMVAHFYQAASRKLSGNAYKTVGGRWRRDGIVGFQVTKDGNVVINSVSWEQLAENARKAAKTKAARDVYATAGAPIEPAIVADTKQYLSNLIDGKPGAEGLGEPRRDFINNLLGIRIASNADVNPLFDSTAAPKIVLTNLRLDRMNRVAPLDSVEYAWGPQQYRRAKMNLRPDSEQETVTSPAVRVGDSTFTGEDHDAIEQKLLRDGTVTRDQISKLDEDASGFVTSSGRFVSREEAFKIARQSGQVRKARAPYGGGLATEDLNSKLEEDRKNANRQFRPDAAEMGDNVDFASVPSDPEIRDALSSDKKEFVGAHRKLAAGTPVGLRIDIPAFLRTGKYVVTVHEKASGGSVGKRIGYDGVAAVDEPKFFSNERGAEKIRDGNAKFPIATVEGKFNPSREIPGDLADWTPVGYDPKEHSYFYEKNSGDPVLSGERAVSVGNTVFVKSPVFGERSNFAFRPETKKVDSKSNTKEPLTRGNGSKVVPEKLGAARDRADVPAGPQFDGDRLPAAVKAKTLTLVHYTNAALGKAQELDPKFMGKGRATPADQTGAPATFYFLKGSPLNTDRDIIARGKNAYSAEVSGARIYDGVNDPLDHWSAINRWKADQALIDAGYVGKQFKFRDGRQAVMLFEKAKVTDRGLYDGKARAGFAEAPRKLREEDSPQFRPDTNTETQRVASSYMRRTFGEGYVPHSNYDELPEAKIRQIADFFDNEATHEPRNPDVRTSYDTLIAETKAQYEAMVDAGITIEPWLAGKGEPYKSSVEMMKDVRDNKHLFFFLTDNGFGSDGETLEHPMLEPSGIKLGDRELLNNDLFRAVHDYFGHTPQGFQFGPRGEFNAWRSHSAMFSEGAQGALAAETLAQNAWVNFGPHLREADGKIAGKGMPGYVAPQDRPFADQRAFVVPRELMQFRPDAVEGATKVKLPSYAKRSAIKNEVGTSFENLSVTKGASSLAKTVLESDPTTLFARLDLAREKITDDPMRMADPKGYAEFMRDAGVHGDILTAPPTLKVLLEQPQQYVDNLLGGYHGNKTKPGTMEAADAGLDGTLRMRDAIKGRPPELVSALHHFWGILSRMLPPVEQESAWLRLVSRPQIVEQIQRSIDGTYELTADQWKNLVQSSLKETSVVANGRGNQGTSNANAFHGMLARWNGAWSQVSDVYSADNSIDSGRAFWALGRGPVGIKNKVQRFIGLTFGIPGLIMDRWKFVELFYPQFGQKASDYFKYSTTGTPEDPNGIYGAYGVAEGSNSAFSLAFYEGMETVLQKAIDQSPELKGVLGRHANVGGLHWKGWNAIKNEAVGHSSLDLTYDLVTADPKARPETLLRLFGEKEYYTEGLVGNRMSRFTLLKTETK